MASKAEKLYMRDSVLAGCLPCRNIGFEDTPAEFHHVVEGRRRLGHFYGFGACLHHHRGGVVGDSIHSGNKAWEKNHKSERDLVKQNWQELGYKGDEKYGS